MANISRMLECALFSHVLLFESLLLSITVMIFFFFFLICSCVGCSPMQEPRLEDEFLLCRRLRFFAVVSLSFVSALFFFLFVKLRV